MRARGDWAIRLPGVEPGGWSFEFENDLYPDVDDAAVVALALDKLGAGGAAVERACRWIAGMQSSNGGWAAFDVDNDAYWLYDVPFCDFGAVIDPPSVDVTAHVVELLASRPEYEEVVRARCRLSPERAAERWVLVRAVGRQLRLRDRCGATGARGCRLPVEPSGDGSGRGLARGTPERGRRVRRGLSLVRRRRGGCRLARARHYRRRRRRRGRSPVSSPPAPHDVSRPAVRLHGSASSSGQTGTGTRSTSPEPASRATF